MNKAPSILITGASGFIGSFLVEKALACGFNTWAGIRDSSSKEYLQDKRIHFIDFNFSNQEELTRQLFEFKNRHGKFDYIIHNAGVTKCYNKNDFDKVNFQFTANLISALINSDCVPKKFILMSSLSVMGCGDEKTYTPFKTDDIPKPNTAYGKSKLKAEAYLQKQNDFPYLIFRPTGVYGPREKDYFLMLKAVKSGLNVGAGFRSQHLTFIYVKDLVNVIFAGIESDIINKTYFVTDGDVYTNEEYTYIIKKMLNKKHVFSFNIPLWLLKIISIVAEQTARLVKKPSTLNRDKYKIMKQRNWECDITSLINDFNFKAEYNLEQGIKESIEWYRRNNWLT